MKVFFGDNQFLGVNHSSGKGSEYLDKYKTPESIAETLRDAWNTGIRDFSFTVNDKTIAAINLIKDECPFNLHPCLPYAHRINELILEKGLAGTVFFKIKQFGFFSIVSAGTKAMFSKYSKMIDLLIRSELNGIPMENVHSIGLLNVATDFLLGSKRFDLLYDFYDVVTTKYKCKPLFYTNNFEKLADNFWGNGLSKCAIVFNYNKSGFRTNPSLESLTLAISKYHDRETIAMSVFSGSKPNEVEGILAKVPSLSGVLFGSSKKINIENSYELIKRL